MAMYELLTITPVLDGDEVPADSSSQIEKTIQKHGGEVKEKKDWGRKVLKHPIAGQTQGEYLFWQVELEGKKVQALKSELGLQEKILRAIIVKSEGSS